MTRSQALRRIETLTEEQWRRAAPYLEADLEAAEGDMADLLGAVDVGRESARTEPLLDNDAVFAMARDRFARA
jgi:hypothetical protein